MPYQYGMQNSPSGGNGLGGLPKKQTTPEQSNYTRVIGTAGTGTVQGTIVPPANAKYMRVAAIGAGGTSNGAAGAGGGGCAASKIVPAAPISYVIPNNQGSGTTAVFPGYSLFGQAGGGAPGSGPFSAGLGGIGRGGDYNYSGGLGGSNAGGGAAGPMGNGKGRDDISPNLATGWGVGGGASPGGSATICGGSGSGASLTAAFSEQEPVTPWGKSGNAGAGGELGGGAPGSNGGSGGAGGVVVEWFYD